MSKRNDGKYKRSKRDFYRTPLGAEARLIPYLRRDNIRTFAEVCCGDGDLIRNIEPYGFTCVYRGDITTGQNALDLTHAECNGAQVGITNPPYRDADDPNPKSARLLLALIRHFLDIGLPSWWLLPLDFAANEYAASPLKYCTDIVVVGRLQWIADSKHKSGFDNSCWYRFDALCRSKYPAFHNDRDRPAEIHPSAYYCLDCQYDTGSDEYYMLRPAVWRKANPTKFGMLCIGCVEKRLGRRLVPKDFMGSPINELTDEWPKSARLLSRITGDAEVEVASLVREAAE